MTLTTTQAIISILIMAGVTFLTRALPFLLFDRGSGPPKIVLYLGKWLPPAVIAMLVVYCLRTVNPLVGSRGIPELLAICAVIALHLWKRNNLLSIFGGTILYMILVQAVFI